MSLNLPVTDPTEGKSSVESAINAKPLAALWRLMAGFHPLYFMATFSVGIAALARTAIFYLLAYFIDSVLVDDSLRYLVPWVALAFIALAFGQGLFTYVGGRLAAQTAEGVARRLRNYIYDHVQRLSYSYHDRMQTGELLQRSTSDVDAVRRLFSEQIIGIGRISLLFIVNFIALLNLNVQLAFVSVVTLPFILIVSVIFFRKLGDAFEANQAQEAIVSNRLQENITGVRVVKAFARQTFEQDKFDVENRGLLAKARRLTLMHGAFWPTTDLICGAQMLLGFYVGARFAISGTISVGTYVAYVGFINQIIWPLRHMGRLVAQMSTGLVSLGRINGVLEETRESLVEGEVEPAGSLQGAVRFTNVNFAYSAPNPNATPMDNEAVGATVLHDINLNVEPGQVVALLGGTGSGKTTLVNLLPRFYEYQEGSITIDGRELNTYPRGYLREQIGVVHQEPFLFSVTIRENITYGLKRAVSDEEVAVAARAAAVHDVILGFPDGYNTLVGERGVTLSGGQKQRLALARTLLQNPSILLLDDATSAVDTETEAAIRHALKQLMDSATTFLIAHRITTVMHADLILVLDGGRIIQRGTHHELIEQAGMYRDIFHLQGRIETELSDELARAEQVEPIVSERPSKVLPTGA